MFSFNKTVHSNRASTKERCNRLFSRWPSVFSSEVMIVRVKAKQQHKKSMQMRTGASFIFANVPSVSAFVFLEYRDPSIWGLQTAWQPLRSSSSDPRVHTIAQKNREGLKETMEEKRRTPPHPHPTSAGLLLLSVWDAPGDNRVRDEGMLS